VPPHFSPQSEALEMNQLKANYKIFCPVDLYPYTDQEDFPKYGLAIQDVLSCSENISFVQIKGFVFSPKISWQQDYLPHDLKVTKGRHNCFVFELDLPLKYPIDPLKEQEFSDKIQGRSYHESKPPDYSELGNKWRNADRFVYQAYYFLALLQIAHPRMFYSEKMEVYIDDEFFYHGVSMSNFLFDPWESHGNGWPKLHSIKMYDLWTWLVKYDINLLERSTSKAGRAILAILQIFSTKNFSVSHHLMWSMNGIEAIYKTQWFQVTRQVVERSQLILGTTEGLDKSLNNLYDFRSRYAHGELDMYPIYHEADITIDPVNKYYREVGSQIRLAILVLVASLQQLVIQDRSEFSFAPIRAKNKANR